MTRALSKRRGFLGMDTVLAVGLTILLVAAFSAAYRQFAKAGRVCDAERDLRLAAEAELLSLRASGLAPRGDALSSRPTQRTVNGAVLETKARPGEGIWSGLTHVTVIARKRFEASWLQVELTAYIPSLETQP